MTPSPMLAPRAVRTNAGATFAKIIFLVARAKLFEILSRIIQNGIFVARAGFFFVLSSPHT